MIRTSLMGDEQFLNFISTHPVSGAKGDQTARNTEAQTAQFTNQLQGVFANNNAAQQNQLNFLSQKLQDGVANPQGYSPQALAAMRTQATEQGAQANKDVMGAVQNKFATQGGADSLPSGVQAQIDAGVASQIAQNEGNQQLGITEQDAQLQNENKWRAIQGEGSVAGMENPTGFASSASNAATSTAQLSSADTAAAGPTWGSILGGVVQHGMDLAAKAGTGGG